MPKFLLQRIETIEVEGAVTLDEAQAKFLDEGDNPDKGVEVISIDYFEHLDNKVKAVG